MNNDRKFKGVWIPVELWLNKDLSPLDKVLLSEIIYLDKGPGCKASNKYLADFLQINESNIKKHIKKLKDLGYIEEISFDGRKRYLKSNIEKNYNKKISDQNRADRQLEIELAEVSKSSCLPARNENVSIENIIENIKEILLYNKKKSLKCLENIGLINKKTKKTKKIYDENSIQYKLANFLYREIENQDPIFTKPDLNKWSNTINFILYVDKKDPEEIKKIISWSVRNRFHQNLLVDPLYLRRNYELLRKQSNNLNNKKESYLDKLLKENEENERK